MKIAVILLIVVLPWTVLARQTTGSGTAVFFDSTAFGDAFRITMDNVSSPASGKLYYGWLGRDQDGEFISLGELSVQGGTMVHVYKHPNDSNLIGLVKKFVISEETVPFSGSSPTASSIVFADSLHGSGLPSPESPLARIRNCVVRFSNTAQNLGLAIWMKKHIKDYTDHAGFARSGAINNNAGEARTHSDHIFDFIEGRLTGFVAGNGSVAFNGDPVGYGYRRYGDPGTGDSTQGGAGSQGGAGYHVSLVVNDPSATDQMKKAGASALTALANAFGTANDAGFAKEVTDRALNIINGVYVTGALVTEGDPFLALALKFLNGTAGPADTASATGGIQQAYYHMQQMATFVITGPVTSVEKDRHAIPETFALQQNFPNPFNPATSLLFQLPVESNVLLTIHDVLGREIARIVNAEVLPAGRHVRVWEGTVSSGTYFARLEILDAAIPPITRRMLLLR